MKWNIFRGHVPAPVPIKPLSVLDESSPAALRLRAELAQAKNKAKADAEWVSFMEPILKAAADRGETSVSVSSSRFSASEEDMMAAGTARGFITRATYGDLKVYWSKQ